jgi:hypothetical protein
MTVEDVLECMTRRVKNTKCYMTTTLASHYGGS